MGVPTAIIGAPYYDNGENWEGQAYVYHGSATGLGVTSTWTAEGNLADAGFGYNVSSAGDINGDGYGDVIISARNYAGGETNEGRVYVYQGTYYGVSSAASWTSEGKQASAYFGHSVSSAGDVNGDGYGDVVIGAPYYDNGEMDEGMACVYHGSASGLSVISAWTTEGNQADAQFGYSVSSAGDVNRDGYGDVAVGVPYFDTGLSDVGRVFLFQGKATGLSTSADQLLDGATANELFGFSVSTAGDVNGDGYCDIIVGAPYYSNGETNEGRIYIYLGNTSGVGASPAWTVESNQADAQLGFDIASAGDVNGDGYSDILLASPFYSNQGRVYLHAGSASGLGSNPLWFADGGQAEAQFGYSIASAGDVNGDGFSDVVIGAPLYDNGQIDEGRAYLYQGHAGGLGSVPVWSGESDQANAQYGHSVSSAGDVNGDGYSDVIIGANLYDGAQSNEGRAYVYHGGPGGLNTSFAWTAESGQNSAQFGCSVATAGDVDNDGYGDVVIGAFQFPNGRAYTYHGSSSGLASPAEWMGEGEQASSQFGYSVAGAGDVNGDGYADVMIGAPSYDNGQTDEGRALLYYGNSGTAFKSLPRQLRPSDLSLIGPAGLASNSNSNTDFLVRLFAHRPTRAKLQVQVARVGQGIANGTLFRQSAYTDVASGLDLNFTITGLETSQAYSWRARLLYDPSQADNGQLHSPWYSMSWGSLSGNADFRTGPVASATPTPTPVPRLADFQGRIIDKKYFFVYPNPTRGVDVKFKFFLNQDARLSVKVYTPSGKFVWAKDRHYPQGWNEITWNTSGIANGVYFYIGEAENGNVKERIIKKIGLVK